MYGVRVTPCKRQAKPACVSVCLYRVPSLGSSLYMHLHSTGPGCYPDDTLQGFQSALVASTADGGGQ